MFIYFKTIWSTKSSHKISTNFDYNEQTNNEEKKINETQRPLAKCVIMIYD